MGKQKGKEPKTVVELAILVLKQWQGAQDRSFDFSFGFMTHSDGAEHWNKLNETQLRSILTQLCLKILGSIASR